MLFSSTYNTHIWFKDMDSCCPHALVARGGSREFFQRDNMDDTKEYRGLRVDITAHIRRPKVRSIIYSGDINQAPLEYSFILVSRLDELGTVSTEIGTCSRFLEEKVVMSGGLSTVGGGGGYDDSLGGVVIGT